MRVYAERRSDTLYFKLNGEIDEHNASLARRDADRAAETFAPSCKRAVFDLSDVSFMDSSGIGLVLGRYRLISSMGGKIIVWSIKISPTQLSGGYLKDSDYSSAIALAAAIAFS